MSRAAPGLMPRLCAAVASAGAGIVHAAVVPGHVEAWLLAGIFFGLLAAVQLGWAAAVLWRPSRPVVVLGLVVSLASIALWALSRSPLGLPFGPDAGQAQPVGRSDVVSVILEAVVVVGVLVWLLAARRNAAPGAWSWASVVPAAVGSVLLAGLSAAGVQAALAHDHSAHGGGHGEHEHGHDAPADEGGGGPSGGSPSPEPSQGSTPEPTGSPGSGPESPAPEHSPSPTDSGGGGHDDGHDHEH